MDYKTDPVNNMNGFGPESLQFQFASQFNLNLNTTKQFNLNLNTTTAIKLTKVGCQSQTMIRYMHAFN
jgi:hypothetical protein